MTTVILVLATLAVLAFVAAGLRSMLAADGFGHRPLPRSHRDEQALELAHWRG